MAGVPADRPSDFGRDVFPEALARGEILRGFTTRDTVVDLGTPERLEVFQKRWGGSKT
jgi:NDP-sugar pyrophosphorylase family protein